MKRSDIVFSLVLLAFAIGAAAVSSQWNSRSRLFVQIVAVPLAVMLLIQVAKSLRSSGRSDASFRSQMDTDIGGDLPIELVVQRGWRFIAWLAAFLVSTWLLGLLFGGLPVVALYMLLDGGESIPSAVATVAISAAVLIALNEYLSVQLPVGILLR